MSGCDEVHGDRSVAATHAGRRSCPHGLIISPLLALLATSAFEGRRRRAGEGQIAVGVLGVALVVIETIVAVMEAVAFGQARAILLIGGPLAALFASRSLALGQDLRALADVAEYVENQQRMIR